MKCIDSKYEILFFFFGILLFSETLVSSQFRRTFLSILFVQVFDFLWRSFFREIVMCLLVPSVIYMYYKVIFAVIDENMCLQLTSNEIYHQYRKALTYSINSSLNSQATAAIPANGILDASIVIWIYHDLCEKLISRTDSSYFYDYTVWFRLVVTCAIFVHLYVLVIGHSLAFQSKTLSNRPAGVRTRNGMSFFSVDMLFNRCHRKNPL